MNKISLAALLDEDREMVLANIARDRSLPATQAALEREIDRVTYRYVEGCDDEAARDGGARPNVRVELRTRTRM